MILVVVLMRLGVLVGSGLLMFNWSVVLIVLLFSFIFICALFVLNC